MKYTIGREGKLREAPTKVNKRVLFSVRRMSVCCNKPMDSVVDPELGMVYICPRCGVKHME